ncbi:hypothetical protein [Rhodococcus sp. 27YEA15]|uniref:hypothetical protein n=1 Tax=Rhodococcus sp. 27YEA15 TaxID=3156259 RepID=UPI003C7A7724
MIQHVFSLRSRRLQLILCLLAATLLAATTVAEVRAAPSYLAYLDLADTNPDGADGGGLNPALPLDRNQLHSALESARTAGIEPRRYATLLRQYWLAVGADNAHIDLAGWDPQLGLAANRATVDKVYVNYLRMTNARPELYWSGMAGLAGVSFAAGFYDLGSLSDTLGVDAVRQTAAAAARGTAGISATDLPDDLGRLIRDTPQLSKSDADWYLQNLLTMQKHIFIDLVPMHEAYMASGPTGTAEFERAGLFDENLTAAWKSIADGTPEGLVDGLVRLASREQNQIIADQWDQVARGRDGMGRVLTYFTTLAGKPAVPGTPAPGNYAPITVTTDILGTKTTLTGPLPDFNWADREPRWKFITDELAPKYAAAVQQHPQDTAVLLATPFTDMSARGRLTARLPDLLTDLSTGWKVGT